MVIALLISLLRLTLPVLKRTSVRLPPTARVSSSLAVDIASVLKLSNRTPVPWASEGRPWSLLQSRSIAAHRVDPAPVGLSAGDVHGPACPSARLRVCRHP